MKIISALFLFFMLAPASSLQAQAACTGLRIRNDSSKALDEQALCRAAQFWTDQGTQVYIFATDERPATEDGWFALRDEVEGQWRIYDPANKTFAKNALAIEVTTDTSSPWGQDIAFGENLFTTPLDNDSVVGRLEGRLKNQVAMGDLTAAITGALADAYTTAFPAAAPTAAAEPPEEQDVPANPQPIPAQPAATPDTGRSGGLWYLLGALGLVIAGLLAGPRLLLPAWRARSARIGAQEHLTQLSRKIDGLLYAARTLFTGHAVEETTLWKLFLVYGGDKYPDQAQPVREWTQHSMTALDEALVLKDELDHREPGKNTDDLDAMIRAYEMLYLTLVGTNPRILQMNEDEFRSFIDPMAGGLEPVAQAAGLVEQVRELRTEIANQPLRVELTMVKPEEVDADGVFGYANRIKETIDRLGQAQTAAPGALQAAHSARTEMAGGDFPAGLSPDTALGTVDALLAQADDAAHQERWLDVQQQAAAARTLLEALGTLLPETLAAVDAQQSAQQAWQQLIAAGYRLPFLAAAQQQLETITAEMHAQIAAGNIDAARQAVQNLNALIGETLRTAHSRAALREHNTAELQRLSAEVARIEHKRSAEAGPAWERLRTYPRGNWENIAGNFDQATATLQRLFDDPANTGDLASTIERKNAMDEQAFEAAEQALVEAFAAAGQAEAGIEALTSRLKEVQQIEAGAQAGVATAKTALEQATARRDQDNSKIDVVVDQQIQAAGERLAQAREKMAQRSFVEGAALLNEARDLTNRAHTGADEQARTIDGLFRQLDAGRGTAPTIVARARQEQTGLVAAAQQASTSAMVVAAEAALEQTRLHDADVSGKQDRALATALQTAIAGYAQAQTTAAQALQQIAADRHAYQETVNTAQAAIAAALAARDAARTYVGASYADVAGRTTLTQAEGLIPALPPQGASAAAYLRIAEQARQAQGFAQRAAQEAQARIAEVEAALAAERRRREEEQRRRQEAEAAERRRRDASARAADSARRRSSWSSSSRSSSHSSSSRRSSMGSSSSSRSSSMGSSRRR